MKIANKLQPLQWDKIIESASALSKQKKVVVIDVDAMPSSDFSLIDGDNDLNVKSESSRSLSRELIQGEDENGSDYYS